ncbi:MAG: hypothetical protein DRJ43_01620 [Thermoprotei archaeon]|nr:MAG: hypothetical protein DRJ43_01620 [Thermoprotei archaeon]
MVLHRFRANLLGLEGSREETGPSKRCPTQYQFRTRKPLNLPSSLHKREVLDAGPIPAPLLTSVEHQRSFS